MEPVEGRPKAVESTMQWIRRPTSGRAIRGTALGLWVGVVSGALNASSDGAVRVVSPPDGAVVAGWQTIALDGSEEGPAFLLISINGRWAYSTNRLPCQFPWSTTDWPNGSCVVRVEVYDAAWQCSEVQQIQVTIRNPEAAESRALAAEEQSGPPDPPARLTGPPVAPRESGPPGGTAASRKTPREGPQRPSSEGQRTPEPRIFVFVHGHPTPAVVSGYRAGGQVLVPVRPVFEALGADVQWQPEGRTVRVQKDRWTVWLTPGASAARVNQGTVPLPGPVVIEEQRALMPVRGIERVWPAKVVWKTNPHRVVIQLTSLQRGN